MTDKNMLKVSSSTSLAIIFSVHMTCRGFPGTLRHTVSSFQQQNSNFQHARNQYEHAGAVGRHMAKQTAPYKAQICPDSITGTCSLRIRSKTDSNQVYTWFKLQATMEQDNVCTVMTYSLPFVCLYFVAHIAKQMRHDLSKAISQPRLMST